MDTLLPWNKLQNPSVQASPLSEMCIAYSMHVSTFTGMSSWEECLTLPLFLHEQDLGEEYTTEK